VPGRCLDASARLPVLASERKYLFFYQADPARCPGTAWEAATRHPGGAQAPADLSMWKFPTWSEMRSMLHGFPLFPICLKILPHLHKNGCRVLITCESAWAPPCTTWRRSGSCPASRPIPALPLSSKFLKIHRLPPGLFPIFAQCDQGITHPTNKSIFLVKHRYIRKSIGTY